MKTGKDIYTLFREGSENLKVQPSAQSWQRLERRLDSGNDKTGRLVWLKRMAAAAAVVLVVGGLFLMSDSLHRQNLALQIGPVPQRLELLQNTEGCQPYCLVLEAREELLLNYAYSVEKLN